jgi:hypothetical protein
MATSGIADGILLRSINKGGRVWGDGFSPKVIWGVVKEKAKTFSQAATSTLRGAFLRLLLNSDTAEDGDRDRTVGAGGDFPAENVALKFISAHLSGVVIVRKS